MNTTETRTIRIGPPTAEGLEARVGNTPLVRLSRVAAGVSVDVQILAKAEWFNPSGSVKDRPALNIIRTALDNGDLGRGRRLLDSTSGNMGIAYATFCSAVGIPITLCVPASASPERLRVLRALGAEVVLTDGAEGSDGAILRARSMALAAPDRYWYANQYDNPANWQAHYNSTGPEIIAQTSGEVTHLVAGLGTSGTLIGTGRYLREQLPQVQVVGVQPDAAFHGLEGLKHMPTAIKPAIFEEGFADQTVNVSTESAHEMVRALAAQEGLFAGVSSGAAVVAALQIAAGLRKGKIVTVLPDAGYKYLSDHALWEGT